MIEMECCDGSEGLFHASLGPQIVRFQVDTKFIG